MHRPDTLDPAERARLDTIFAAHPRLRSARDALGEMHRHCLADNRKVALDRFADIYGTGLIPELSSVVDTFLAWHQEILDWHQA